MKDINDMTDLQFENFLADANKRQSRLKEIVQTVFKKDVHYGSVTGEKGKPTLLKPGAEEICAMFDVVADYVAENVNRGDGKAQPNVSVLMRCELKQHDKLVGVGYGAANDFEVKFRYRQGKHVCLKCNAAAVIKDKQVKGGFFCAPWLGGCKAKLAAGSYAGDPQRITTEDPHDLENNLVKYAKKRSLIDAVLAWSGLSAFFTQDVEDMGLTKKHEDDGEDPFGDSKPAVPAAPEAAPVGDPFDPFAPAPKAPATAAESSDFTRSIVAEAAKQVAIVAAVVSASERPKPTGDLRVDIVGLAGWIASVKGGAVEDHIQNASKFEGNSGFRMPGARHSEKWLKNTLSKLERAADDAVLQQGVGEPAF